MVKFNDREISGLTDHQKENRASWKSAISGACGNLTALIFQPLENVKLRLQVNDGMKNHHLPQYRGFVDWATSMWKQEGYIAFYRGAYINIFANTVSNFMFFGFYGDGKKRYNYNRETSPWWHAALLSFRASWMTVMFVNPLWCIKTRIILNFNQKEHHMRGYELVKQTASNMYIKEGIPSFYRGMLASFFLSLYSVVQMTWYEQLSKFFGISERSKNGSIRPELLIFFVGGTSRAIASLTFYPINVVKHRIQKQRYSFKDAENYKKSNQIDISSASQKEVFYTTYRHSFKSIYYNEGVRGFYKGWVPNLIRIFLDSGVFFLIFETMNRALDKF